MARTKREPRWLDATGPLFVVSRPASRPGPVPPAPEPTVLARRRRGSRRLVALPGAAVLVAIAVLLGRGAPEAPVVGILAAVAQLVGLAALATALTGARGRRYALAALISAIVGTGLLLATLRTPVVASATGVRPALRWSQLAGDAPPLLVAIGVVAVGLSWLLAGVAIARSRVLGRGDGVLLILAAPLLAIGGAVAGVVPVLGALLVVAAGIGLTGARERLVPDQPR
ncbi:MAG TPA: hypothetical protein VF054_13530 [Micromonosporaceae bacterium]